MGTNSTAGTTKNDEQNSGELLLIFDAMERPDHGEWTRMKRRINEQIEHKRNNGGCLWSLCRSSAGYLAPFMGPKMRDMSNLVVAVVDRSSFLQQK